jgi:cytochrome P450
VETEQDLLARARERAEALEEAAAGAVCEEIVRGQDPAESVFARIAARDYSISEECLVIQ